MSNEYNTYVLKIISFSLKTIYKTNINILLIYFYKHYYDNKFEHSFAEKLMHIEIYTFNVYMFNEIYNYFIYELVQLNSRISYCFGTLQ